MMPIRFFGPVLLLIFGGACTRPLRLSGNPISPTEPLLSGVVRYLFASRTAQGPVALDDSVIDMPGTAQSDIRDYWAADARRGFAQALAGLADRSGQNRQLDAEVVRALPPRVVVSPALVNSGTIRARLSHLALSPDSLFAVAYLEISCGPLCGHGALYFFARRPGCDWTFWDQVGYWRS
jgi:hypothetical protein